MSCVERKRGRVCMKCDVCEMREREGWSACWCVLYVREDERADVCVMCVVCCVVCVWRESERAGCMNVWCVCERGERERGRVY